MGAIGSLSIDSRDRAPTAVAIGPFPRTARLASAVLGFLQLTAAAAYGILVDRFYDGTPIAMAVAIAAAGLAATGAFRVVRARRAG